MYFIHKILIYIHYVLLASQQGNVFCRKSLKNRMNYFYFCSIIRISNLETTYYEYFLLDLSQRISATHIISIFI